jgi:arylsulfatase A-like enzyme
MGCSRLAAQRWDSLACLSPAHSFMQTPHMEALASRGTVFENCYTTAPLCVPMRASMMSGMYASTTGIMGNNHWLSPATPVWSSAAADQGFATAAIGKMHFAPWDDMGGFGERITAEDKRHVYLPDDHAAFLAEHGHERAHPTANPGYYKAKFTGLTQNSPVDPAV